MKTMKIMFTREMYINTNIYIYTLICKYDIEINQNYYIPRYSSI